MLADEALGRNDPIFNRGKKKEVLLDDVVKNGKRPSLGSSKAERQPKPKPKQHNSSQHPTSGFPGVSSHTNVNGSTQIATNRKRNTGPTYTNSGTMELKKTINRQMDLSNLPLHDLESIEDLGVTTVLGDHQDLDTWLNFEDDGLPEHDALDTMDLSCLEIPMDDLSDLNMIL